MQNTPGKELIEDDDELIPYAAPFHVAVAEPAPPTSSQRLASLGDFAHKAAPAAASQIAAIAGVSDYSAAASALQLVDSGSEDGLPKSTKKLGRAKARAEAQRAQPAATKWLNGRPVVVKAAAKRPRLGEVARDDGWTGRRSGTTTKAMVVGAGRRLAVGKEEGEEEEDVDEEEDEEEAEEEEEEEEEPRLKKKVKSHHAKGAKGWVGGASVRALELNAMELLADSEEGGEEFGDDYEEEESDGEGVNIVRKRGFHTRSRGGGLAGEGAEGEDDVEIVPRDGSGGASKPSGGAASSSRSNQAAAEKLAKGAACLRHLAPSEKVRFAALWGHAERIRSKLAATATLRTPRDGASSAADTETPVAASQGGDADGALVTPQRLRSVLGWGIVGASDLAAGSGVGTGNGVGADSAEGAEARSSLNLTSYQLVGLNWLLLLDRNGLNGVLADEMGLGKSVQSIGLLMWLAAGGGKGPDFARTGPHLIVTPASTIGNWARELKKWAPNLRVGTYRGGSDRTAQQIALKTGEGLEELLRAATGTKAEETEASPDEAGAEEGGAESGDEDSGSERSESSSDDTLDNESDNGRRDKPSEDTPRAFDVCITTYTLFDKVGALGLADAAFLRSFPFSYIICDEGHYLKNASSQRFGALASLNAKHRLLLTGTPIQNTLGELFSLLRFLDKDLFTRRAEGLFTAQAASASKAKLDGFLSDLKRVVSPFILRRSKSDVLKDLPKKTEETRTVALPPAHATIYSALLADARTLLNIKSREAEALRATMASERAQTGPAWGKHFAAPVPGKDGARGVRAAATKARAGIEAVASFERAPTRMLSSSSASGASVELSQPVVEVEVSGADAGEPQPQAAIRIASAFLGDRAEGEAIVPLKKAGKRQLVGVFGELRRASQHPLLLRVWYARDDTLARIATALAAAGAFGKDAAAAPNTPRVRAHVAELSDYAIWELTRECAAVAYHVEGQMDAPADGGKIVPITAPAHLKGKALLVHVCLALPPWALASSAKIAWLGTFLPERVASGHRVLLFSQLMDLLSIVGHALTGWGIRWLRLDGSTPVTERTRIIDAFNADPGIGVFLVSTKAGGLGLNLTAADTVIIHDSDWNPHSDAQAVDRAHRLGQRRPVSVYRLVAGGTLDDKIAAVAAAKLNLDRALSSKGDAADAADADANIEQLLHDALM